MPGTLRIAYGGHSSAGHKPRNEDAFAALLPAGQLRASKGAIAAIADGVSCSDNAQVASQTSVTTFIQDYLSTPETWDVKTSASRVLAALNSWLHYQGRMTLARHNGFVTTFSAVILRSTTAHVLHCGDSRVWRYRKGQLLQMTADHNFARDDGTALLTRALGMDTELKVDYQQRSLRVDDLLLLTTDGVHGTLGQQDLAGVLASVAAQSPGSEGGSAKLEQAARLLVETALAAGSSDNLSCLLVRVLDLPLEDINEAHDKLLRLAIPPVLAPGNRLDDYTVVQVLHSGARSHLYLATHPRYRQKFVLKAPSPNFAEDPQYLEGFLREQWVGRRMDHPGIMKIFEPVPDGRFLYHVCEYIEGDTLRQWLYDNPSPELGKVRDLARQIATSLRVLQRLGMLHRDLKPENVMLTRDGQVKLIDFGTVLVSGLQDLASPLREEVPVGTADYMAPEYLLGERGEHRSDIFSLGVIVYEMLTGALPYKVPSTHPGRKPGYSFWQYRSALALRPELPPWLDLALAKACAPRPSQRYAALSEFLHDLEVPNPQLLAAQQHKPLIEQNPVRFWQGVAALLLLLLLLQAAWS